MSSAVSAPPPGGLHRDPEPMSAKDQQKARALGLTSATGLVVGTIVGAGVFTMPAVLASAGTLSLLVLGVIAAGAMVLAVLFGQLTRRVPNADEQQRQVLQHHGDVLDPGRLPDPGQVDRRRDPQPDQGDPPVPQARRLDLSLIHI